MTGKGIRIVEEISFEPSLSRNVFCGAKSEGNKLGEIGILITFMGKCANGRDP